MNEQLKEFAKQAGFEIHHAGVATVSFWVDNKLEKFAQMIVSECANQCTTDGPFGAEVVWGKQFHKKILEHFGVEE